MLGDASIYGRIGEWYSLNRGKTDETDIVQFSVSLFVLSKMSGPPRFITAAELLQIQGEIYADRLRAEGRASDPVVGPTGDRTRSAENARRPNEAEVETEQELPLAQEPWSPDYISETDDEDMDEPDVPVGSEICDLPGSVSVTTGSSGSRRVSAGPPVETLVADEPEEVVREFRLQGRRFMFTYATHLNKEEWIRWFSQVTHRVPEFIRCAHERADEECPYEHTHIIIDMGTVYNKRDATRAFDYPAPAGYVDRHGRRKEFLHPHFKSLPSAKAFDDAKGYLSKEDPANEDLAHFRRPETRGGVSRNQADSDLVERIWRANSLQDALRDNVEKVGDTLGIVQLYRYRPATESNLPQLAPEEMWAWQRELVEEVRTPAVPHNGKVIWYFDHDGQHGKERIQKYLVMEDKDEHGRRKWWRNTGSCSTKHVLQAAKDVLRSGWTGHGVLIDMPRARAVNDELYNIIEQFLNGVFTSSMYEGGTVEMPWTPWVIVFANFWPKISALSTSRWVLRELVGPQRQEPELFHRDVNYEYQG